MKFPPASLLFCLLIILGINISGLSQSTRVKPQPVEEFKLKQINPDGWFSLLFPPVTEHVGRHADREGGFVSSAAFRLDWDYWTYESTPNALRDSHGRYSKRPQLACSQNAVTRIKIDGKNALMQRCFHKNAEDSFRYEYYLTFPKANIYNGQSREDGVFNLSIFYKNPSYRRIAERIANSLKLGESVRKAD